MGNYKGHGSPVTSWIIYSLAVVVPVVMSQPVLTSSVEQICLGDTIVFTCTTNGSSTITWRSEEYIGPGSQQLQLRSIDPIGTIRRSTSNPDTVANLTAVNTNGPTILMSTLHIKTRSTTSNVSVSCISANGRIFPLMIPLAVVPGAPQNVKAAEVSERIDRNCIILVTWDPPSNTDESDIDRYIINIPSRSIVDNVSSAITVLRIQNCRSDDVIQVTAVNRFGCVGQNSFEIQPSLLDDRAKTPGSTTQGSTTTTPIGSTASTSVIVVATIAALLFIIIVLLILVWLFMRRYKRGKKAQDTEKQDVSADLTFVHLIEHNLQKLYKALKSENDRLIRVAAKALSRTLEEESSTKYIKEALHNFLEQVQTENDEDIKQCHTALNKMDNIITGMRGLELNTEFKETVRQLRTNSGKEFKEILDKFTQKVDAEVEPENVMDILQTLCGKLQSIHQVKGFYQNQSKYNYSDLSTENDRVKVPIWINGKLDSTWKQSLHKAVQAINEAAPGLSLSVTAKKGAIVHVLPTDEKVAYTEGNILVRLSPQRSNFIAKIYLGKWKDDSKNGICIHELLHALGFHHKDQNTDTRSYEYPLDSGKKLSINENCLGLFHFDSSSTTLYRCEVKTPECEEHSEDSICMWLLTVDPIQQNIELDELDMVALNLVYRPCRDTAPGNAGYRPKPGKNGMYYCEREVMKGRIYPKVDEKYTHFCGPDNGPNCPACRTIKNKKVDKILKGGRWQGMTGRVYCGRLFAEPADIFNTHDGMCGMDNGPACPECYEILNENLSVNQ